MSWCFLPSFPGPLAPRSPSSFPVSKGRSSRDSDATCDKVHEQKGHLVLSVKTSLLGSRVHCSNGKKESSERLSGGGDTSSTNSRSGRGRPAPGLSSKPLSEHWPLSLCIVSLLEGSGDAGRWQPRTEAKNSRLPGLQRNCKTSGNGPKSRRLTRPYQTAGSSWLQNQLACWE